MESQATSRKRTRRQPTSFKPYFSDSDVDESVDMDQPMLLDQTTSTFLIDVDKPTFSLEDDALRDSGFIDADLAGGYQSKNYTLILTEGLSAKSFVMTCLSHVGREMYGVYPLRGKIKNVRNMKAIDQSVLDKDSQNIATALGIRAGIDYTDLTQLRYGHVLIMADQDNDGIHIKGLVMNLFHRVWPSLLNLKGFLQDFITILMKATHKQTGQEYHFKSVEEYKKWEMDQNPNDLNKWEVKYYKGLASHNEKEAIQYSQNMENHLRVFNPCENDKEKEELDRWMQIAFCRNCSHLRKKWLENEVKNGHGPDYREKHITIQTFIQRELVLYVKESVQRSIPLVVDGLKPSERKVLFYLFEKDKESTNQKVCDLSGNVFGAAAYHHGDAVLEKVVVKMAQDFVGSNTMNLLEPNGQFGSRREVDDSLVKHRCEDGKSVEPNWYAPVAPLVLINGVVGIGTGYKTSVPSYKPSDVIENIRRLIDSKPIKQMVPWYCNFQGDVVPDEKHKGTYIVRGKWELGNKLKVDDVPPGVWYEDYEKMLAAKKKNREIKDYKRISKGGKELFEIDLIEDLETSKMEKMFDLSKKVSKTNLVLLDPSGQVKHYDSVGAVLQDFFNARLPIYEQRKNKLLDERKAELDKAVSEEQRTILHQKIWDLQGNPSTTLWKYDLDHLEEALSYNEEIKTFTHAPKSSDAVKNRPISETGLAGILKSYYDRLACF